MLHSISMPATVAKELGGRVVAFQINTLTWDTGDLRDPLQISCMTLGKLFKSLCTLLSMLRSSPWPWPDYVFIHHLAQ